MLCLQLKCLLIPAVVSKQIRVIVPSWRLVCATGMPHKTAYTFLARATPCAMRAQIPRAYNLPTG